VCYDKYFILMILTITFYDQLRFITTKIVSSPQCHGRFHKITCSKYAGNQSTERLVGLMVVQDVHTQWNYTQGMIDRALDMRQVSDFFVTYLIYDNFLLTGNRSVGYGIRGDG
jgi:hypothetical protein